MRLKPVVLAVLLFGACAALALALLGPALWRHASVEGSERDRESLRQRAEYATWSEGSSARELAGEREWQAAPLTSCSAFGRGAAPQVCIEHTGPAIAAIGTPVTYRVRWRNLPQGAYIRVWSRNAAPAGRRWSYSGPQGAIAPAPLGGAPDGDERVTWDGRGVYCAPSDLPMMCDAGEVGRYVLRAAILTGSDPFWPSWPPARPIPVVRHARSETRPFTLDGAPQQVPMHAAIEAIREIVPPGALGTDWYLERRIGRIGPWLADGAHFCARLDLDRPLAGWASVCFPRSRRDAYGVALRPFDVAAHGEARLADGLIPAGGARRKAVAYAVQLTGGRATFASYPSEEDMVRVLHPDPKTYDRQYQALRNAARDAGLTYVEVNQPNPSFRDDPEGSWWLVEMSLWIGMIDGPRVEDWGRLALRVDHDGHVCRVDPTGEREGPDGREVYSACRPGSRRPV